MEVENTEIKLDKKIIPAILTDVIEDLEDQISEIENVSDLVQVDFVDGYFADELTCCEAHLIEELEVSTSLEIHLMVEEPITQVRDWYQAGAARLVGHIEEMEDQVEFVEAVSKLGMEVGLALNVDTPLEDLDPDIVESLNVVLLMGHEVGVQGTKFDKAVLDKITELRADYPNLNIEMDGGVNKDNIQEMVAAGANWFAVGSDIFGSEDPKKEYRKLVELIEGVG